jgi:hypothetical protein
VSKKQAHLFAAVADNPQFAKRVGIPQSVGREFNQADQRTGILKRGAGGRSPNESGMNAKMNFGQGHGHSLFSTMPLMGHALSGTQLGQVDSTIRNAHARLARFAEGGEVKKAAGPSAKERAQIRDMIERGKDDALSALRNTRAALAQSAFPASNDDDFTPQIESLRSRLTMQDGGKVDEPETKMRGEHAALTRQLHDEHDSSDPRELLQRLVDLEKHMEMIARNKAYAKPPPAGGYLTTLSPKEEDAFQAWVKQNAIPFDASPTADYDMRGFWKGLMTGDPRAHTDVNPNDKRLHFSDYWKTPYHKSFSAESQWATDQAPRWNDKDQLVLPNGQVVVDEREPAAAN